MTTQSINQKKHFRSVIIIGGGLGGLALCQALRASNVKATVYERDASPESRDQGYYIGINEDGARVLTSLNLPELVPLLAQQKAHGFNVLDRRLFLLANLSFKPNKKTPGEVESGLVNRIQLREYLTHGIMDNIVWNKKFVRYEEFPDRVVAYFEDGTEAEAELLVGCDGANSRVRAQRCPDLKTENIRISNFAASVKSPDESQIPSLAKYMNGNMVRVLGLNGHTVLMATIEKNGEKETFWALSHPTDSGEDVSQDEESRRKLYHQKATMFHPEVQRLIKMPSELIMFRELQVVKPLSYNPLKPSSRVTLLGDASHAMTTHLGLGANTALLDAADLAEILKSGRDLSFYEEKMIKRGFSAIKQSRGSTNGIHSTGFMSYFIWVMFYLVGTFMWLRKKIGY